MRSQTFLAALAVLLASSSGVPASGASAPSTGNVCDRPYFRAAFGSTAPTASTRKKSIAMWKNIDYYIDAPVVGTADIDHVMPLAPTWPTTCAWTQARRVAFANDQYNLRPTTAHTNRSKSDQTPAQWSPAKKDKACQYGTLFLSVSAKWSIPVDPADVQAVEYACMPLGYDPSLA